MSGREVWCFDPGPHTGVAFFRGGELVFTETVGAEPDEFGLGGRLWMYERLRVLLGLEGTPVVVIEGYHTVAPIGVDGMETIKLIGWLEGLALTNGHNVCFQMPSVKKPWLTEAAQLVKARGGSRHERDATAHGLAWIYRNEGTTR